MNFDEDEARVVTRVKLCCLHCGTHRPAELLGCSSLFSLLNAPKKKGNWLRVTHGSDSKTLKVTECSGEEERSARWPETCLGPLTFALQGACLWKVESFWAFFFLPSCSSVFLLKAKFRASTVRVLVYIQWNWYTLVSLLKSSLWKVTWASIFQSWYVSFLTQDLGLLLYSRLSLGDEGRKEAICLSRFLWNCC